MSYRELIESLRREGQENIDLLWSGVRDQAAEANKEADTKIIALRDTYRKEAEAIMKRRGDVIIARAERDSRAIRLQAVQALSERLFTLAMTLLSEAGVNSGRKNFCALADELPSLAWEGLRVNPRDEAVAAERFPGAEITTDGSLSGGMEAYCDNGRISVVNTFEKRLENAWEEILPLILNDITTGVREHASPVQA